MDWGPNQERIKMCGKRIPDTPCSFNLGSVDISDINATFETTSIGSLIIRKNTLAFLKKDLTDTYDDELFEPAIWKNNLLTRVYFELDEIANAIKLNKEILENSPDNLTAQANSAFLFFLNEEIKEFFRIINQIKELKMTGGYKRMKLGALIEQAYAYQKFGGEKNFLSCINLFTLVSSQIHLDEKNQFLHALVYRRISVTNVFWQYKKTSETEHYATEAAKRLHSLGTTASDPTIRAAAIVELAYLRYQDRFKGTRQVSTQVWRDLLGDMSWRQLCFKALEITSSSDRVLKMAGQVLKSNLKTIDKAIECLKKAIEIRPSSRAHHHLGIAYTHKAIQYETEMRKTSQTASHNQILPDSLNNVEKRLRMIFKISKENYISFGPENEFAKLAEDNFSKAVEVGHRLNIKAYHGLAHLLLRRQNYVKAKQKCTELINFLLQDANLEIAEKFTLVTVYDLNGTICAIEADRAANDSATKVLLSEQSEQMLEKAVKMATKLALEAPDFKNCGANLWESFGRLTKMYTDVGSSESIEKLVYLCELVKDYRNLPKVREMMVLLETNDCPRDFIERYIENLLGNNQHDDAASFLEMANIRFGVGRALMWRNSKVVKRVMLYQARTILRLSTNIVDPIWLTIMKEEFDSTSLKGENLKDLISLNIIIIEDIGDDYEPVRGSWSDKVSCVLKEIIQFNFGISVLRCHEIGQPGQQVLEVLQKAISTSTVAMFVIDNELNLSSTSRDSQIQDVAPSVSPCSGTSTQDVYSEWFKFVIEAAVNSNTRDSKPAHILTVTNTDQTTELPSLLIDKPKLAVSKLEVDCLSQASNIKMDEKIEIIMRIFCKIVRTNYVSPKVSVSSGAVSIEAASVSHRLLHGAEA